MSGRPASKLLNQSIAPRSKGPLARAPAAAVSAGAPRVNTRTRLCRREAFQASGSARGAAARTACAGMAPRCPAPAAGSAPPAPPDGSPAEHPEPPPPPRGSESRRGRRCLSASSATAETSSTVIRSRPCQAARARRSQHRQIRAHAFHAGGVTELGYVLKRGSVQGDPGRALAGAPAAVDQSGLLGGKACAKALRVPIELEPQGHDLRTLGWRDFSGQRAPRARSDRSAGA